ncbi:MAG: efflux RND transporter periplasmic adaptor subunit [Candidatus Riflebacteria bacterium]|nr:efflux RND transporter periplasmic adaptor subunit [Candidatus Riflebacteria bacterium]
MKKTTKTLLSTVIAIGVAALLLASWRYLHSEDHAALPEATVRAARRSLSSIVQATGGVKPCIGAEVRVGARISGRVEKLRANIGDAVSRGQVLAVLERTELQADVATCEATLLEAQARLAAARNQRPKEVRRAEANLDDARATARLSQINWERTKSLYAKRVTALNSLDLATRERDCAAAKATLARADLDLASIRMPDDIRTAEAAVEAKRAALAAARARLEYATILAPIPGVVASVSTQEGETVAAGLSAPTFLTIIDLGRLQVDTFVDEVDIGKVTVGQKATFTVDSFPTREFRGTVAAIYPKAVIQENVVNYDVVVRIAEPYDNLLRPEMTASVRIELGRRENVLTVPITAVKRERGRSMVQVLSGRQTEVREVKIGWKDSEGIEITSGLADGDVVLVDPQASARPAEQ